MSNVSANVDGDRTSEAGSHPAPHQASCTREENPRRGRQKKQILVTPLDEKSSGSLCAVLEDELEGVEDELLVVSMAITVDEPWVCAAVSVVCDRIKSRVGAVRERLRELR